MIRGPLRSTGVASLHLSSGSKAPTASRTLRTVSSWQSSKASFKHQTSPLTTQPSPFIQSRSFTTSPRTMSAPTDSTKDWSSKQYLKFNNERTRPVHDLVAQLQPLIPSNPRIYDLGCGPANSTAVLASAFPGAHITGIDSSPDMIARARATLPTATFHLSDLSTFSLPDAAAVDLVFSNAVFHWLRQAERIPTLVRLFENLKSGAVLAFQMPDNYTQPSHALMRDVAQLPDTPWTAAFANVRIADLADTDRPDLDPIESVETYYDALVPLAAGVNVWRTTFLHVVDGPAAVVEWVKGTGLLPYLNMIEGEEAKKAFLNEYQKRLEGPYRRMKDGKVLLAYPRLFVVAVRK